MKNLNHVLVQCLGEQIALEEHLYSEIEKQISEIDESNYGDAKTVLMKTKEVLEEHFNSLNESLDTLERDAKETRKQMIVGNGDGSREPFFPAKAKTRISIHLRNNYVALNLVTMSNALLHTTALALNYQEVAAIALKHLQNLAPLVAQIGGLLPDVVARELYAESPDIDPSIGKIALKNAQLVWLKSI
jgi:glutathionyl-hydroquinone reductase